MRYVYQLRDWPNFTWDKPQVLERLVPSDKDVDGVVEMTLYATRNHEKKLTNKDSLTVLSSLDYARNRKSLC